MATNNIHRSIKRDVKNNKKFSRYLANLRKQSRYNLATLCDDDYDCKDNLLEQ